MARTRRLIHGSSSQMDDYNPRGFKQINLEVTGVEVGRARFLSESGTPPRIAQWRNNLTALSQYHNLYFVACRDEVHVYQPLFPNQTLGREPVMIIKLPVSQLGLRGYIDPSCPHAANFLLIDDLGDEEVLAIACDDGDVLLYHTRNVANKIKSKLERGAFNDDVAADQVNPFFQENFQVSAWGLAMHKTGRMLAVSSNTHNIDVIAFGLCSHKQRPSDGSSDEDMEPPQTEEGLVSASGTSTTNSRRDEKRVKLRGHGSNIPCVAFCNSKYDSKGDWLASTDIDGVLLVWNIWTEEIVARYKFGDSPRAYPGVFWNDRPRGWGVLCLDRNTFKMTSTITELYGSDKVDAKQHAVDISCTREEVKDSSSRFGYLTRSSNQSAFVPLADTDAFPEEDEDAEADDDFDDDGDDDDDDGDGNGDGDNEHGDDGDDVDYPGLYGAFAMDWGTDPVETQLQTLIDENLADLVGPEYSEQAETFAGAESQPDHEEDGQENGEDDEAATEEQGEQENDHQKEAQLATGVAQEEPKASSPRFAILHTTETAVRLLSTPYTGLTAVCHRALHQDVPPQLSFLARWERLNMVGQVPELNLVVVGNQMGKVGLFTPTRFPQVESAGLRLEFLLPFATQERDGMRPARSLLGVAIGPIQGREKLIDPHGFDETSPRRIRKQLWNKVEKTRRYRLMLTYTDHTVLSYEIGRDNNPSAGRDGELMVA